MEIRFFRDPDTNLPHIYGHGVSEEEVREVLRRRGDDFPSTEGSRMKLGKTLAGRYLKVVYVVEAVPGNIFVVTAHELRGKAKSAFRRRQRRKPR